MQYTKIRMNNRRVNNLNNDINIRAEFFTKLPPQAKEIRQTVFIEEQGFKNEFDDIDAQAYHLVIFDASDNAAIGTARLFTEGSDKSVYTVGRLSVLKAYRKHHLGSIMLSYLEEKAHQLGAVKLVLSAQYRVRNFYEKQGYHASGEIYLDEYCPHIQMEKFL